MTATTETHHNTGTVTDVDMLRGPMGSNGFRSGYWTATTDDGRKFRFYGSLPHQDGLNRERIAEQAQRCVDAGNVEWM
jgi:hypothetical protein